MGSDQWIENLDEGGEPRWGGTSMGLHPSLSYATPSGLVCGVIDDEGFVFRESGLDKLGGQHAHEASSLVHLRSALLVSTAEIFVSTFSHRSPPHRFLCSSMRCFENSPKRASLGGLPDSLPVSHQRISTPL
jgi:hypothetical protein